MGLGFCFRFTVVCLSFIVKKYLVESASVARNINQMIEEKTQTAMLDGLDKIRVVYPPSWNLSVPVTTDITYSNESSAKPQSVNSWRHSTWNQKVFSGDFSNGHADRSESYPAPRLIMSPSSVRSNNKLDRVQPNYNLVSRNLLQNLYKENIYQNVLADNLFDGTRHDEKTTQYATSRIKITERSTIVRATHPKIVPLKNLSLPVLSCPKNIFSQFLARSCNHKLKSLYLAPSKELQGNYKPVNFMRAIINYAMNGIQPRVSNKTSVKSNETRMFQTLDIKSNRHGPFSKIIFSDEHFPLAGSNNVQTQKAAVKSSKSENFWIAPSAKSTISHLNSYNNEADQASRENVTAPYVTLQRPVNDSEFTTKTVYSSKNKYKGYKNVTFNNTSMPLKHTKVQESNFSESDLITRTSVMQKYELNQTNHTAVHLDKTDLNSFLSQGHVHPTMGISNGNDIENFSSRENVIISQKSTSSFAIGRRIKVSSMNERNSNLVNTPSQSSVSKSPIIRKWNNKYKLSNNQTINFYNNKTPPEIVIQRPELTTPAKKSPMQDSFPKPTGHKNFIPIEFADVAGSASFHVNK